jgi:ATP-dependent Lon protease
LTCAQVLAAYYSGVNRVVLPTLNHQRDLTEIPATIRAGMEFIPAASVEDVLANTLPHAAPVALAKL